LWNCRDPSQDDRKLISEFLDAYYGKAAPFVRLYMDTMHGSISDTNFWMGEGFPLDAAFLTPIALLTSATAFVDGRATVTGLELERLNRAAMAVYYPILMRWAELRSFAQAESMHWPLEPTIEGAFDAFASAFNATTAAYCGDSAHCVAPAFREGATGSSLLLQLQQQLVYPHPLVSCCEIVLICQAGLGTAMGKLTLFWERSRLTGAGSQPTL
jgi:hypothetical protein